MTTPTDVDEDLLDAALELFGDLGIERTTINDVARKAGVNRVTVYRRIGSKVELVAAVMAREAVRLFEAVAAAAKAQPTFSERLAHGFATTVESVRSNPVLVAMSQSGTDLVLGQLTTAGGEILGAAMMATQSMIDTAVEDQVPGVVPVLPYANELLVRVAHSILLTPEVAAPLSTYDDLVEFALSTLLPAICVCPTQSDDLVSPN
ncbi:TetR/AcrR family transcriptional regulator [Williamsia sp. CHRR-6]|uniref:TetR/AcrR family transcriptional regulator n=1 Tax=Williamsia sp. CHRR-6 TaxID=2835871 RepID=UPI001BDB3434|nr:TetR/AcrR family transcriptional regulator [Williamsia sp. CHRR-6]MBT0567253.1 TetR/AcrR family transcriptional regulator [Williamsia sp. CHRR-6]